MAGSETSERTKWSRTVIGTVMVSRSAIRFRSIHVDGDGALLYGSDDADDSDGWVVRLFRSMPSFPALDNEGGSYRITLRSWFRSELRLEIEPSPTRRVRWFDVTDDEGQISRIEITESLPARTMVGPLGPAPPESGDDILSRLVLETLTDRDMDPTPPTRRDYERSQLDGIRRGVFRIKPPSQAFIRSLDALELALDEPEGEMSGIPHSWVAVLSGRDRADGRRWISDPAIVLEPIDGATIGVETVVSEPERWLLYLTASPDWSIRVAPKAMRDAVLLTATDDRGGSYAPTSNGGQFGDGAPAIQCLVFRPRLDPEARELRLVLSGPTEAIAVVMAING